MDDAHFEQTVALQFIYHQVQMAIHQPLIPLLTENGITNLLSSPSLAICRDTARSISHILEVRGARPNGIQTPYCGLTLNTGMLSLVNIWAAKKSGLDVDVSVYVKDVQTCIKTLTVAEQRYVTDLLCLHEHAPVLILSISLGGTLQGISG